MLRWIGASSWVCSIVRSFSDGLNLGQRRGVDERVYLLDGGRHHGGAVAVREYTRCVAPGQEEAI
eukprot:7567071-Lingulodinium_polyedra.AAC.1